MVTDVGTSLHIVQHRDEEPTYYRPHELRNIAGGP